MQYSYSPTVSASSKDVIKIKKKCFLYAETYYMLRFVQIRNNRYENRLIFLLLANKNIVTITFCRFTFCFNILMAKQTNRRHIYKRFFSKIEELRNYVKKKRTDIGTIVVVFRHHVIIGIEMLSKWRHPSLVDRILKSISFPYPT
jgi:hypothetical protein